MGIVISEMSEILPDGYPELLQDLKARVQDAQVRAALAVNSELVLLYWDIGHEILTRQKVEGWGTRVIDRLSVDLRSAFPNMQGFSPRNLKYMRAFAEAWTDVAIVQQLAAQLPWFHTCVLLDKLKVQTDRVWYARQAIENLLELGAGFAFMGSQYHLEFDDEDYFLDLLFYHVKLRCYVIIELKRGKFLPEYAGKMNFYLAVADDVLRHPDDAPTIGLILCKEKKSVTVEYALRGMVAPIGVSGYQLTESLPEALKTSLPTIEQLEAELRQLDEADE